MTLEKMLKKMDIQPEWKAEGMIDILDAGGFTDNQIIAIVKLLKYWHA